MSTEAEKLLKIIEDMKREKAEAEKRATLLKEALREGVSDVDRAKADTEYKHRVEAGYKSAPSMSPGVTFAQLFSTDICFLVDTTGSMGPYIETVKNEMTKMIQDIKNFFLNEAGVRIAVVSYKDFDAPVKEQIQVLDFTTSVEEVVGFIGTLNADHGGDAPEDVQGAMAAVHNLAWHQSVRCVIHIADAPAHGRRYNNLSDDYPDESSNYSPLSETMGRIIKKDINYTLFRITPHTDMMFGEFEKMYTASKYRNKDTQMTLLCTQLQLGTEFNIIRRSIVGTVTKVAATIGSMTLTKKTKDLALEVAGKHSPHRALELDTSDPKWSNPAFFPKQFKAFAFSTNLGSLEDMMYGTFHTSKRTLDCYMHEKPFAQGAMRYAFYAKTSSSSLRLVAKKFKTTGYGMEYLEDDMRAQALCKAFALEFSNLPVPYNFDFLCTVVLMSRDLVSADASKKEVDFYSLEPFLGKVSDYVKYNSNFGYVLEDGEHKELSDAAQAFSHFTFERSKGQILVADLQGLGQTLTDPVIHARNKSLFKLLGGNLGVEGFKAFFMAHKCNSTCAALKLKSNRENFQNPGLDFFEDWSSLASKRREVYHCCSNKLCGKMVKRIVETTTASKLPSSSSKLDPAGMVWCSLCKSLLEESSAEAACNAEGCTAIFTYCPFQYEALLEDVPRKCPLHRSSPAMASRIAGVHMSTSRRNPLAESMGGRRLFPLDE